MDILYNTANCSTLKYMSGVGLNSILYFIFCILKILAEGQSAVYFLKIKLNLEIELFSFLDGYFFIIVSVSNADFVMVE